MAAKINDHPVFDWTCYVKAPVKEGRKTLIDFVDTYLLLTRTT